MEGQSRCVAAGLGTQGSGGLGVKHLSLSQTWVCLLACTVKSGCGEGECSVYFKETSPSYSPNYMFPVLFLLRFYLTLLYFINSVQYDVLTSHNS